MTMNQDPVPVVRSRETLFQGRVIQLDREQIELSNGVRTTLELIRHRGSVVIVPQPAPGQIILIRQYRHAIGRWIWEVPAGTLDKGEDPVDGARRECEEEIGLVPGRVTRLGAGYPTPGFCDELMTFYLVEDLGPATGNAHQDEDEQIVSQVFEIAEAERMAAEGEIVDMKTQLALAFLRQRRHNNLRSSK
jgi:ADP-ribose pyrophosphatase